MKQYTVELWYQEEGKDAVLLDSTEEKRHSHALIVAIERVSLRRPKRGDFEVQIEHLESGDTLVHLEEYPAWEDGREYFAYVISP